MAQIITQEQKEKLYTQVFHLLGMPVRGIELTEEQMDTFLDLSLSEYEQYVSDWLIESQWSALAGLDVDNQSLSRAFTTRSLDYETQYTYSYSKIVGLQAGGDWELKKDFITLERGQQTYQIPAGREINELLWFSRAALTDSIIEKHTLIVNTSPLGMYPNVNETPAIPYEAISSQHHLFDLIYNPSETLFLSKGKAQGATIQNGLEMLHIQAEESWKIWNAETPIIQ